MKKIILSALSLLLTSMPVVAAIPTVHQQSNETAMKKERVAKPKKETGPKNDNEIGKCIMDKFSNSERLKAQGFNAKVRDGEATLTGQAQNAGSKGAATRIAQSCGARSVKNDISAPRIPKPKKSDEQRPEPPKRG